MVLFYVDDSGDERLTTFSAIGVPVGNGLGDCVIGDNAEGPPEDGPSETLSKTEYVAGADDSTKRAGR